MLCLRFSIPKTWEHFQVVKKVDMHYVSKRIPVVVWAMPES